MIKKIISGGQTGADQATLDAAIKLEFPYGGWIPKGRMTESGPLANMDLDDLVDLHSSLFVYFKNAFGLWPGNTELMESCQSLSNDPVNNENDAAVVILVVLRKKLQGSHRMRVVK